MNTQWLFLLYISFPMYTMDSTFSKKVKKVIEAHQKTYKDISKSFLTQQDAVIMTENNEESNISFVSSDFIINMDIKNETISIKPSFIKDNETNNINLGNVNQYDKLFTLNKEHSRYSLIHNIIMQGAMHKMPLERKSKSLLKSYVIVIPMHTILKEIIETLL